MSLFDLTVPIEQRLIKPNYFRGNKFDTAILALSGHKNDGSTNLFGKLTDFIPGAGPLKNWGAQQITSGTDSEGNIQDNLDNSIAKGTIGLNVAKGITGAVTGNPAMLKDGIMGTIGGAGALIGAGSQPNYSDDFKLADVTSGKLNRKGMNDTYSFRGAAFKDGGVILDKTFFAKPEGALDANDPNFYAKAASISLFNDARSRVIERPSSSVGDISGIKTKDSRVNLVGLNSNLTQYFNSVPSEIKNLLLATSGKDQPGVHVAGSDHGKGSAIDFRLNLKALDFIKNDPNAKKLGIVPQLHNAGTASHLHVKSLFKVGGSPMKSGITKEIASKILGGGMVNGHKLSAKQIEYFKRYLPKKKMEIGGEIPFIPYADDNHKEDFYMVDKSLASKVGLDKILERVSFGQARYNERIFDQKANLAMKMIMGSSVSMDKKKDVLGNLVFDELKTHSDIKLMRPAVKDKVLVGQAFFDGGPTLTSSIISQYGNTTDPRTSATTAGLNAYQNDFYDNQLNKIQNGNPLGLTNYFDAMQAKPLSEIAKSNLTTTKELSPKPYDNQNNLGVNSLPGASLGIKAKTPEQPGLPSNPDKKAGLGLTGIFDTAKDALGLVSGLAMASQKMPDFKPSQDFIDRQAQIKSQADQGFTVNETAQFNKSKNDAYDMGATSIINNVGGGVNQGAALAALNGLQGQRLSSDLNFAIADNNKMLQNQQIYDRSLQNQLALDESLYSNKVNFINQNRNIGAQLVQGTLQNIESRKIQEKSGELNSTINDYYKSLIDKYKNTNDKQSSVFAS